MRLYLQISSALSFLTGLLGLISMHRAHCRRNLGTAFVAFSAAFIGWAASYFLWQCSSDPDSAITYCRFMVCFGGFVGPGLVLLMGVWFPAINSRALIISSYALATAHGFLALGSDWVVERLVPEFGEPYWPVAGPGGWIFVIVFGLGLIAVALPVAHSFREKLRGVQVQQMRVFALIALLGVLGYVTNIPGFLYLSIPPYANIMAPVSVWAMTQLLWPHSSLLPPVIPWRYIQTPKKTSRLGSYFEDYPSAPLAYNIAGAIIAVLVTPLMVIGIFGLGGLDDGTATLRAFLGSLALTLFLAALLPGVRRFVRGWTEIEAPSADVVATAARERNVSLIISSLAKLLDGPVILYRPARLDGHFALAATSLRNPSCPAKLEPSSGLLFEGVEQRTFFDTGQVARKWGRHEMPPDWNWALPVVEDGVLVMLAFTIINNNGRNRLGLEKALGNAQIILYQFSFNERLVSAMARKASDTSLLQTGQLAAKLVHELRTPLSGLDIYFAQSRALIEAIALGTETETVAGILAKYPYDIKELMGQIDRYSVSRRRVDEALEAIRPFTDTQDNSSAVSLAELLSHVEMLCRAELSMAEANLVYDVPGKIMLHVGRAAGLQVFTNLVRNAAEAIEESGGGGFITVLFSERVHDCVIHVRDTGPGLPLSVVEALNSGKRIMSTKQTQSWKSRGSGYGLGLNLVREHLSAIGSELTYDPLDRSFCFHLPMQVPQK